MATHSSILAWRIPRTEEPGGLQSMGSQSDTTEQLTLHFHFLYYIIALNSCALSCPKSPALQADSLPLSHLRKQYYFSSVQSLSCVRLFVTPWIAACQPSLFITNSQSLPKLTSIESVMPSSHLILCHPLLLPSIFPSIRVFSNESVLHSRWPKYWSYNFSINPSNECSGLISFRVD